MNSLSSKYTCTTLTQATHNPPLPWLLDDQDFPATEAAWGISSDAPGLLCAGDALDAIHLRTAYSRGIFPWFSGDQPVLWWSPDPRMVLHVDEFRVSPTFKRTLRKFSKSSDCEVKFDSAFTQVIQACANAERRGQRGTWIMPEMVEAYQELHELGLAHSVETWVSGQLVGGLYCVALGRAVFGESMFHLRTDASKIALAALIGFCRQEKMPQIDCQQNTRHLASLGAREVPRTVFESRIAHLIKQPSPDWRFSPIYWNHFLANL